jgi:tetratricopeptide (TPR) repeat protein
MLVLAVPRSATAGSRDLDPALKLFGEGKYAEVVELLSTVEKDSADYAKAQYLIGESQLGLGAPEPAAAAFRAVLETKPQAVPALTGLGKALSRQGKHDEAIETLEKAVKADRKDADAQRSLGEAYAAAGKTAEAEKELMKAWKLDREDPYTARALVEVLLARDAVKEAQSVAAKVAKANKAHPMGHFLMGICLERLKEDDAAIVAYEKSIEADETFIDAHKNLAILCMTVNPVYTDKVRTQKALTHFEKYFELGGDDARLRQLYTQLKGFMDSQNRGR